MSADPEMPAWFGWALNLLGIGAMTKLPAQIRIEGGC